RQKEEGLRLRPELSVQDDLADLLRRRDAARLARRDYFEPGLAERGGEPPDLARLPAALRAFECDEHERGSAPGDPDPAMRLRADAGAAEVVRLHDLVLETPHVGVLRQQLYRLARLEDALDPLLRFAQGRRGISLRVEPEHLPQDRLDLHL